MPRLTAAPAGMAEEVLEISRSAAAAISAVNVALATVNRR